MPNSGTAAFQIRVTNNGPATVADATLQVSISDRFRVDPGPTNFPSYCSLAGAVGSQTLTCTLPSLAVGSLTLNYNAVAIAPGSANTQAAISSPTAADPNSANDSLTITPAVVSGADLSTTLDDGLTGHTISAGSTISYQLTVSNGGPNATDAVTLTDNLPPSSDLHFLSAAGTGWACNASGQVVTCIYGGPAITGAYPAVTITGQVVRTTTGTITNNAFASLNSPLVGDPNGNNNTATPVVTTITAGTDLQALKTMPATILIDPAVASSTITIGASNVGPQAASDATVTDAIPSALTIDGTVALPSGCSITPPQTVTCHTGALNPGAQKTFDIKVRGAVAGVGFTNIATAASTDGLPDPNTGNNSQSRTFQVQAPGADLTLTKTKTNAAGTSDPIGPNQNIVNTIRVTNNGPSVVSFDPVNNPLIIKDQLDPNETYVSVNPGLWNCSAQGSVVTCKRNDTNTLAVNGVNTLIINTRSSPTANGPISNTACTGTTGGSLATPLDPFAGNDCVTATLIASTASADIAISKTVSLTPESGGGYVTNLDVPGTANSFYVKLVATNLGGSPSTSITVTDKVAGNYRGGGVATAYTVVDANGNAIAPGTVTIASDGTVTWTIATLGVGTANAQTLYVRVDRPIDAGTSLAAQTNTATIKSADVYDPITTNNSASASYTIHPVADVQLNAKTVAPNPTQVGVTAIYTISTSNAGPNFAENVTVDDVIDTTKFDLVGNPSTTKSDGTCSVTNGSGTATIHCDLGTYQRNNSFQVLQSVRARYPFGGSTTFPQSYTNTATVGTTSTESVTTNNSKSLTHNVTAPGLDLAVTNQEPPGAEFDPIAYGVDLTYDVRVSNFGPSRANNIVTIDTPAPPAGYTMTFHGFTVNDVAATSGLTLYAPPAPNCVVVGATVQCRLDADNASNNFLDPLRQTIFRLRFTPAGAAPSGPLTFTNGAAVIANEQPTTTAVVSDPQLANNTATQTTTVLPSSDLEVVSKTRLTPSPVAPDAPIQYRIVSANNGVSPTTQVRVTDQLPAGFVLATPAPTFQASGSTSVSAMTCTGTNTVLCVLDGNFPADPGHASTVTITLYAKAASPYSGPVNTDLTNTATIAPGLDSGGTPLTGDPISSNNSKTATVQVALTANASIGGTVFADANGDNAVQGGEGLAGVTVALQKSDGTAVATTTTATDGTFLFTGLLADTYRLVETQPSGQFDGRETAGTAGGTVNNAAFGAAAATNTISGIVLPAATNATGYLFQEVPPSSLSGTVFADANNDNAVQTGEGLAGVTLTLTGTDLSNNPVSQTTTTNASGGYIFSGLPAGTYAIVETQPPAYSDGRETAGTAGGTINNAAFGATAATNSISAITLPANTNATGYLFQELSVSSIAGTVFADANNDNAVQAGEGLAGVTVTLTGTDQSNAPIAPRTTTTDASGSFNFGSLVPGTYTLVETQPTGYFDGRETAGSAGGTVNNAAFGTTASTNTISGIVLAGSATGTAYLFQELRPATIGGTIYRDLNNNGAIDSGETGFGPSAFPSSPQVRLTGTDYAGQAVDRSVSVDANGVYSFTNLAPSDSTGYTVTELVQPTGTVDGLDRNGIGALVAGSAGRIAPEGIVVGVVAAGATLANRDFGELPGASIAGAIFLDANTNAIRDSGEMTGLAGGIVRLTGTDDLGHAVDCSITTDATGAYSFPFAGDANLACRVLRPGIYALIETPPAGFTHVGLFIGSLGGTAGGSGSINLPVLGAANLSVTGIAVAAGAAATHYDFAERGQGLTGYVYVDSNGNGVRDSGEQGIAGVTVTLSGTAGSGQNVCTLIPCTATTDASGAFVFANVPGSNSTGYSLTEQSQATAPLSAYGDGADAAGTVGGATRGTAGNDVVTGIVLAAGEMGANYRFGERGAALAGHAYVDANDDGVRQASEAGIAGVTVTLTGTTLGGGNICTLRAAATPALSCTAITAADGSYSFGDLPAGTYSLVETQPGQFADGKESAGTPAGTVNNASFGSAAATNGITAIPLGAGVSGVGYDFGERGAGISGRVFKDPQRDGLDGGGEPGIAGVTVRLLQGSTVVATTTTAADGSYSFTGLTLGAYSVQKDQPAGYGSSSPNTAAVTLTGTAALAVNFADTVSTLAATAFFDSSNDGVRQTSEHGIAGVTITLTGTDAAGAAVSRTAITDASGNIIFGDLLSGSYTVTETQPSAYVDGKDSAGSVGGTVGNDVVSAILLPMGTDATGYAFGERGQSVTGLVYVDTNLNGTHDVGEPGVAGVTITLQRADGTVVATTTTGADGSYGFPSVDLGSYIVFETQPAGYADAAENPTNRATVTVGSSPVTPINFGERGQSLAGLVYFDTDLNGSHGASEPGIAGVTITLQRADGSTFATAQTAADGSYSFASVPLGSYKVIEAQPAGYTSAAENPTDQASVTIAAAAPPAVNFGERGQALHGLVYVDTNLNGTHDAGEPGIGGVTITLQNGGGTVIGTATTVQGDGSYSFPNVQPGQYVVLETQPAGYDSAAENNSNRATVTVGATSPPAVNFGERGQTISGTVYLDANVNGRQDEGEIGIDAVTLTLKDSTGTVIATTTTASSGLYSFTGISNGTYSVVETQPAGYGDAPENASNSVAVTLTGASPPPINFGERAGSIAGAVYDDANFNGHRDANEPAIPGVTVTLTGTDARGNAVSRTAVGGKDGTFRFTSIVGGTYALTETQPANYQDERDTAGTAGGVTQPIPGDTISNIQLPPAQDATGYLFGDRGAGAQLSGSIWFDVNHDGIRDPNEQGKVGWTVQLLLNGAVVATTTSDQNGGYSFADLPPGTGYALLFRDPKSAAAFGSARPNETGMPAQDGVVSPGNPGGADFSTGQLKDIALTPGANVPQQSLPLDPSGVIYDSATRQILAGATIRFDGPSGFDAATQLLGGATNQVQTVGADGFYQFLLLPGAPNGVYTLTVTPPPGSAYTGSTSVALPPCTGPLVVGPTPDPLLISTYNGAPPVNAAATCAPGTASTGYYLSFSLTAGLSANVANNNIPLDPILAGAIVVTKTTPMRDVTRGSLVPYTITAKDTLSAAVPNIAIVDKVPAGFRYRQGSARLNGVPVTPVEQGRLLLFPPQNFAANETKKIDLILTVGAGVGDGEHVNQAYAQNAIVNRIVSNVAEATVRIEPDADFDCSDVLGKVFDDKNGNGYEDEGEPGLPGVRVVTVAGDLITTDAQGRYHITCPQIPDQDRGSNFILKLDPRTLPTGYRLTSENPQTVRMTPGKFVKLNFGAALLRVVRLDVRDTVFSGGAVAPDYAARVDALISTLEDKPSVLRIAYAPHGEDKDAIRKRVAALKAMIERKWGERPRRCRLIVEVEEGR